jgi:hypothetical protein
VGSSVKPYATPLAKPIQHDSASRHRDDSFAGHEYMVKIVADENGRHVLSREAFDEAEHLRRRCHPNLNWRREVRKSQAGSRSRRRSPCSERLVAEDAEAAARGEVALDVERVVNGGMNGQEAGLIRAI